MSESEVGERSKEYLTVSKQLPCDSSGNLSRLNLERLTFDHSQTAQPDHSLVSPSSRDLLLPYFHPQTRCEPW